MTCCSGTSQLDGPVDVWSWPRRPAPGWARAAPASPGTARAGAARRAARRSRSASTPGGAAVGGLDERVRPGVRPLRAGRRGGRALAVAGAAPGGRRAAAARRLDPARRLRARARSWWRCRSAGRRPTGERARGTSPAPLGCSRAHRPPHPLARQRRHADARRSWCAPRRPRASTCVALTDHDTADGWAEADRGRRRGRASTLVRGMEISTRHDGRGRAPARLPARPDVPAAGRRARRGSSRAASARLPAMLERLRELGVDIDRGRRTPAWPAARPRPAARTSPTRWSTLGVVRGPHRGVPRASSSPGGRRTSTATPPPLETMLRVVAAPAA